MTTTTKTREEWLLRAIEIFRPRFVEIGFPLPEKVRISIGWGARGARQESAKILGVTFCRAAAADGVSEIFISPEDADTASMLETVLHELIHVADDCASGHKGAFAEMATRLGFEGPMTSTPPSVELAAELLTIAASLGEYPGAQITIPGRVPAGQPIPVGPNGETLNWTSGPGTQTTRMLKVSCQHDGCLAHGYAVRLSRKWLDGFGAPICPGAEFSGDAHRLSA